MYHDTLFSGGSPCSFPKLRIRKPAEYFFKSSSPIGKTAEAISARALGYLDELKEYEDPIAHFKEVARQMTEEAKAIRLNRVLTLSAEQRLVIGEERRKNIGYFALPHSFITEIDAFVNNRRRYLTFEGNLNHIFQG